MKALITLGCIIFYTAYIFTQDIEKKNEKIDFDKVVYEKTQNLAETLHLVHTQYYASVNPEKSFNEAINTFLKTLDPHSCFMDAAAYKQILETTQGEFPGVGIIIDNTKQQDDDTLRIIDVVPGGPSDKAGIKANDIIVEIAGEPLKGMMVDEIIAKLKGKRNSTVTVKIQRKDTAHLLSFTITRDTVKEPNALCYFIKDHDIHYISFALFTENSVQQLEYLLKKIKKTPSKGIILDLRNNSGGLLPAVIAIAGLFLDQDSLVVVTKDRSNSVVETYKTTRKPIAPTQLPLFILVNSFTASAAEILAGCLQIHAKKQNKSVFVIGNPTFGKGSVQKVIPIGNDCAVKLTTELYELADNTIIQGIGVKPDFPLEPRLCLSPDFAWFNTIFGKESSLKNSIKVDEAKDKKITPPQKEDSKEKNWFEKKQELIANDYLILSTVRLMELLHLMQKSGIAQQKTRDEILILLKKLYTPQDVLSLEEIKL